MRRTVGCAGVFPVRVVLRLAAQMVVLMAWVMAGGAAVSAQTAHITYTESGVAYFRQPQGIVGDASGNIWITDSWGGRLVKEAPNGTGGYTQTVVDTALSTPWGIAKDSAGNLYVSNQGGGQIYKYVFAQDGSFTRTNVLSVSATQIAFDSKNNLYYCYNSGCSKAVLSGGVYSVPSSGFFATGLFDGIVIDSSDNVYIGDYNAATVTKIDSLGNKTTLTLPGISKSNVPSGALAFDALGNFFVGVAYGVYEYSVSGGTYTLASTMSQSLSYGVDSIWVDAAGRVFVADDVAYDVLRFTPNPLGVAPGISFGTIPVGSSSAAQTATITFDTVGTLNAVPFETLVKGDQTLDFQPAATQGPNVCVTGHTYNVGDTCTVAVVFSPVAPGNRMGSLELFGTNGLPVATVLLQGVGTGPQIAYDYYTAVPQNTYYQIKDVKTDDSGNGFAYSYTNGTHRFNLLTGVDNTPTTFATGTPFAIDASGDTINGAIGLLTEVVRNVDGTYTHYSSTGNGQPGTISTSPGNPTGVAVDGSGNIYVADGTKIWIETYGGGGYTESSYTPAAKSLATIAADAGGTLYVTDPTGNQVLKLVPASGGTYTSSTIGSGLSQPAGVAVDPVGNVFIADTGNDRILKETLSGSSYVQSVAYSYPGLQPFALAVDPHDNLVISRQNALTSGVMLLIGQVATKKSFVSTAVGSVSTDSPKSTSIYNIGNQPLVFTVPTSGLNPTITAGFTVNTAGSAACPQIGPSSGGFSLAAGASCANAISFAPVVSGTITGALTFTDNNLNATGATQAIPLSGPATGGSTLSISPVSIVFPNTTVGATSSVMTATLSNSGTAAVYLGKGSLTDATDFTQSDNCGGIVVNNGTCTVSFTFTPKSSGPLTSTYSIDDLNYPNAPVSTVLSGNGVAPVAPTLTPATMSFGTVAVNQFSATQTATLANGGGTAVAITSVSLTGTDAAQFKLSSACGSSVAANSSCAITVTCAPTSIGAKSAQVAVAFPSFATETVTLSCTGSAAVPALTPATISFGTVLVGAKSSAMTATLSNSGNAALAVQNIAITGTNATSFSETDNCGTSVAAGGSCSIQVTCAPAVAGALTATLAANFNSVYPQLTSALSCTGQPVTPPDFTLAATPAAQSVYHGQSVSYALALASVDNTNPFTTAVTLAVKGLPDGATASFAPAMVTPGTSGASVMTVTMPALVGEVRDVSLVRFAVLPVAAVLLLLRRRRVVMLSMLLIAGVAATTLAGCGNGNGFATPTATYTLTVMGTGGTTVHTTTVTMTVK